MSLMNHIHSITYMWFTWLCCATLGWVLKCVGDAWCGLDGTYWTTFRYGNRDSCLLTLTWNVLNLETIQIYLLLICIELLFGTNGIILLSDLSWILFHFSLYLIFKKIYLWLWFWLIILWYAWHWTRCCGHSPTASWQPACHTEGLTTVIVLPKKRTKGERSGKN